MITKEVQQKRFANQYDTVLALWSDGKLAEARELWRRMFPSYLASRREQDLREFVRGQKG